MRTKNEPQQFALLDAPVTGEIERRSRTPVIGDMHLHVIYWVSMGKVTASKFPAEWFMDDTADGYIQGCSVNRKIADLVKLGHLDQYGTPHSDGSKAKVQLTASGITLLAEAQKARLKGRPLERESA